MYCGTRRGDFHCETGLQEKRFALHRISPTKYFILKGWRYFYKGKDRIVQKICIIALHFKVVLSDGKLQAALRFGDIAGIYAI